MQKNNHWNIPDESYFNLDDGIVYEYLNKTLFSPVIDALDRPSKEFRKNLVFFGFKAAKEINGESYVSADEENNLLLAGQVIEMLHTGSLIVDDLQDESSVRRGGPSMHKLYGRSQAISCGNWLYFWPTTLLKKMNLEESVKAKLYESYCQTIEQAHYGQSLDVSVRADELQRGNIKPLCDFIIQNKSGAITGLAVQMGALIGGLNQSEVDKFKKFGVGFGEILQMFDDLGNACQNDDEQKYLEDLKSGRISWVWSCVADSFCEDDFLLFKEAIKALPSTNLMEEWFQKSKFFKIAKRLVTERLKTSYQVLRDAGIEQHAEAYQIIYKLGSKLENAYF